MINNEQYLEFTRTTAIYPKHKELEYLGLGLASEAGEIAGKLKKAIRDSDGILTDAAKIAIKGEIGDVYWYLARLCDSLQFDIDEVLQENKAKLSSRKDRGTIGGNGDIR